jgi:hypothetical protein
VYYSKARRSGCLPRQFKDKTTTQGQEHESLLEVYLLALEEAPLKKQPSASSEWGRAQLPTQASP